MVIFCTSGSMYRAGMIKRTLLIIFFLPLFAALCCSQKTDKDARLRDVVREYGQAEITLPYPGRGSMEYLTRNFSVGSVKDKTVHIIISPLTLDLFLKQGYDYSIIDRKEKKGPLSSSSVSEAMKWESYPTWTQYDSIMRFFSENYPSLCILDTIGTSIRGRLVLVLKISDNASVDEDEPEVFYSSTMHGDEIAGFVLMMRLADYLLKNYDSDNRIKNLVDNLEIWINPLANPDGTYTTGDTITSPTRANANGYDLNRNFPDPVTTNTIKQKETLDMISFMKKRRFVLSANFHSGAEVVNYPWDRWERYHADDRWFNIVSRAYADTVHVYSVPGYFDDLINGVTNGYLWYQIYGGRQDFVTYELRGREVTVELVDDYLTPVYRLPFLWEYNYRSLTGYLENALYGIHGRVTDSDSGDPVYARIYINGHDKDNSYIFSDSLTGTFIRFLEPGFWDLTFTAEGYRDTVLKKIFVKNRQRNDVFVRMIRDFNPVDTTNPSKPLLYPNPGSTYIRAVLPEELRGEVNIKIFSTSGVKLTEYYTETHNREPVIIDVRRFKEGLYIVRFTNTATRISHTGRFIVRKQF